MRYRVKFNLVVSSKPVHTLSDLTDIEYHQVMEVFWLRQVFVLECCLFCCYYEKYALFVCNCMFFLLWESVEGFTVKYHLLRFISLRNASLTIVNILAPYLFMLVYKVETVKLCLWLGGYFCSLLIVTRQICIFWMECQEYEKGKLNFLILSFIIDYSFFHFVI